MTTEATTELRKVKWCNLWNWRQEESGISARIHLTSDGGLAGKTLCGTAFPRAKGFPAGFRYCKRCLKKAGAVDLDSLPWVVCSESGR